VCVCVCVCVCVVLVKERVVLTHGRSSTQGDCAQTLTSHSVLKVDSVTTRVEAHVVEKEVSWCECLVVARALLVPYLCSYIQVMT
jgi:hypothetical protein